MFYEVKVVMYERYQLYQTRLVNIIEKNNYIFIKMEDDTGNIEKFRLQEMLVMDCITEIDNENKVYQSVIYRGKVEIVDKFETKSKIYFFKCIPSKKRWFICGDISELLKKRSCTFSNS